MNKEQFLHQLRCGLEGMSEEDIQKALDFYSEMIEDRIESGMTEQEAAVDIGTPQDAAKQILIETPLPKLIKAKAASRKGLGPWAIMLIILGFPVWGSLAIAVLSVFLSVYVVIWSVVISFYAVNFAVAVCVMGFILASAVLMLRGFVPAAVFLLGAAVLCAGVTVLMFFAFNGVTKAVVYLSKLLLRGVKSLFIVRGDK